MCVVVLFVQIPKVYWDHSTERVLTMEFVDGCQINDLKFMKESKVPINQVCSCVMFYEIN